ncbi:hypothetical protein Droror1_Dr00007014 [Drosera rotundifolia]
MATTATTTNTTITAATPSSETKATAFHRSVPSSGRIASSSISSSSASSLSSHIFRRSPSPTRVSVVPSSIRFSIESSAATNKKQGKNRASTTDQHRKITSKRCLCSPTTHPGSFRCRLHKKSEKIMREGEAMGSSSSRFNMTRRSAMTNSLVRIGSVEGELVRLAIEALIRPSSHQVRRREEFRPRMSRLSIASSAEEVRV